MFVPGDRDRTTQPAVPTPMASIREQELRAEPSIPGQRWLREARAVKVDSTAAVAEDSMAAAEAMAEVAKANR